MYEEDRQTALAMYNQLFDEVDDEQGLLQLLVSPTRQAVVIARSYNAKERKLQVHAQSREESETASDGAAPEFMGVIESIREEALSRQAPKTAEVSADQFSMFEDDFFAPTPETPAAPAEAEPEAPAEEGNEEGTFIKDSQGSTFKITNADSENPEVQYEAPAKNAKGKVKVPAFVKVNGVTYQVTSVSGKAFKGNSKVTKIIIGKNVTKIGKKAFSKCKKLKLLVIKSRKLKTKNVAKNAFKGITKKTTVKVPKSKIKAYRKLLRKKGLSSKVKAIKRVYSSQEV